MKILSAVAGELSRQFLAGHEEDDTAVFTYDADMFVVRGDSLSDMLRATTGHTAAPGRHLIDNRPVSASEAQWVHLTPNVLAGDGKTFVLSGLVLGRGSSGTVHLGVAVGTGELLAFKRTLRSHDAATHAMKVGSLLASMGSSLAPLHLLQTPGSVYFVEALATNDMHGVDENLCGRVRNGLAWLVAQDIIPDLVLLHANAQAHCDIKPCNIMQRSTKIQLIDFDFVKSLDADDYRTTYEYAPPETYGLEPRAQLSHLDRWCLGASLWQIAGGMSACRVLLIKQDAFGESNWRTIYSDMHAHLLSDQEPSEGLSAAQKLIWSGFATLQPIMRSVILQLMTPCPTLRLDLEDVQTMLRQPAALAECDLEAARHYLRCRAQKRMRTLNPALREIEGQLWTHQKVLEEKVGNVPLWLRHAIDPAPRTCSTHHAAVPRFSLSC